MSKQLLEKMGCEHQSSTQNIKSYLHLKVDLPCTVKLYIYLPVSIPGMRVVLNILSIWVEHIGTVPTALSWKEERKENHD